MLLAALTFKPEHMSGNYNYYQMINDILCKDDGVKIIQELDSLYYKS